jgi:GTPase SAR1 family protein
VKIICIVGLPGSGKTHLANRLAVESSNIVMVLDDFSQTTKILPQTRCDLIITDPHFCVTEDRRNADQTIRETYPGAEIEWLFFENNEIKCIINAERRNDGRDVRGTIKRYAKIYQIPEGVNQIEIWS